MPKTANPAADALQVLLLTHSTRAHLMDNDPKALEQAETALAGMLEEPEWKQYRADRENVIANIDSGEAPGVGHYVYIVSDGPSNVFLWVTPTPKNIQQARKHIGHENVALGRLGNIRKPDDLLRLEVSVPPQAQQSMRVHTIDGKAVEVSLGCRS